MPTHAMTPRPHLTPESEAQTLRAFLFLDVLPGLRQDVQALARVTDAQRVAELGASAAEWRNYLRANATGQYADLAPLADATADTIDEAVRAAEERHGWSRPPMRAMRGSDVGR